TLSLGYFQPASARLVDPLLAALPWVRRSTGGASLIHDHELTYALALPPNLAGDSWMPRMHAIIVAGLAALGVHVDLVREPVRLGDVLCFQQQTVGDVLSDGRKVVGSAQRRHRRCLLQHGAILLRQSRSTPALPGLLETTGCDIEPCELAAAIVRASGWDENAGEWSTEERRTIASLVAEKYGNAGWNERR
ncbi:MAG TPA: lipoate--protein ligase family protein, partial [Gemmataceae bacterium]|nr:lipoate--protein ligase family protein [Gemmataceae bacterium]